jgi:two-component system, LuxR family, sensor kinase FixL
VDFPDSEFIGTMKDYRKMSREELLQWIAQFKSRQAARHRVRQKKSAVALDDTEARLRAILATAVEGIVTISERGKIESFNLSAEKMFGYAAAEVIGRNVSVLMPEPHHSQHDGYLANYRGTGHARIIGIGREVTGRRKNGVVFPMDLSVSEVRLADRRIFTGFIRDITDRKQLEKEILEISEREQRRIGHDLHDGICQHLAGIELMSQVLAQKLERRSKDGSERAGEIAKNVRETISQTRALARGLSPVTLEAEGLMSALYELALNTGKIFRVACHFQCEPPVLVADQAVSTHLFRIAQEAVSNALRHGQNVRRVTLQLLVEDDRLILSVRDDGTGFPPDSVALKGNGMGLRIMQSRAGMIGGTLSVGNCPGGGAWVTIAVPRAHETDADHHGRQN